MNLQTRLPNLTTQVDPQRNCTPERSGNSSSLSQTCSSTNSRKPSLLTMLQERDEEIKELRQELQETKEQNSMLSWEKSVLEQELTEKTLIYSSELQEMQSKVAELIEENKKLRKIETPPTRDQEGLSWDEFVRMQKMKDDEDWY